MRWLGVLVLLLPALASAAEGEGAVSASLEVATFSLARPGEEDPISATGSLAGATYERGISDSAWLRVRAYGGAYSSSLGGAVGAAGAGVGGAWALDLLRYVPYLTLSVGGVFLWGGGVDPGVRLHVEIGAGLDVLESPTFSWGVSARVESFASELTSFAIGPRLTWRWGWF